MKSLLFCAGSLLALLLIPSVHAQTALPLVEEAGWDDLRDQGQRLLQTEALRNAPLPVAPRTGGKARKGTGTRSGTTTGGGTKTGTKAKTGTKSRTKAGTKTGGKAGTKARPRIAGKGHGKTTQK